MRGCNVTSATGYVPSSTDNQPNITSNIDKRIQAIVAVTLTALASSVLLPWPITACLLLIDAALIASKLFDCCLSIFERDVVPVNTTFNQRIVQVPHHHTTFTSSSQMTSTVRQTPNSQSEIRAPIKGQPIQKPLLTSSSASTQAAPNFIELSNPSGFSPTFSPEKYRSTKGQLAPKSLLSSFSVSSVVPTQSIGSSEQSSVHSAQTRASIQHKPKPQRLQPSSSVSSVVYSQPNLPLQGLSTAEINLINS